VKKLLITALLLLGSQLSFSQSAETSSTPDKKETVAKQKIKVFPNPATNVVNILGLQNSSKANITISDISGNGVLQRKWAIRNNSLSIPIPNLNPGIYVVRIESEEQSVQTKFYKN